MIKVGGIKYDVASLARPYYKHDCEISGRLGNHTYIIVIPPNKTYPKPISQAFWFWRSDREEGDEEEELEINARCVDGEMHNFVRISKSGDKESIQKKRSSLRNLWG